MKDETGKIVSYDQVYVVGIRFKAIIEFSGGRFVDTYIKFTSPYGQVPYSDIIKNDEFEYNFEFNGIIHTEALMGETTIEDLNDDTIRIRPTDADTTFDMVDFNKTPIYIKISNFYKKGYVYYEDSTGKE
ncbi:hypothetical protein SLOPH_943 [Spraguea lophii 42_110]|uniref:Uncharacterized protein n=1 Tax=Spraguea lophii (strain 42_110) TaxID=1358809 RepID=S7XSS3_SPRLO|nr:hypothetical protein SLOPH_943 [Spraguea lophii 42_110]